MYSIGYLWGKLFKKVRGRAIIESCIDKTSKIEAGSSIVKAEMGRNSFCGYDCMIINCKIGAFCSLADNVSIGLASHPISWVSTSPVFIENKDSIRTKYAKHPYKANIETIIGNDVWIGKGAYIKAGIKVGDGAIIGMGAVVTSDVPDYAIVGGVPARVIRMRFTEEQIQRLKKLSWWNWDDERIKKYGVYITDIEEFLERVEEE